VSKDVRRDFLPFERGATPRGKMGVFGEETFDRIAAESAATGVRKGRIFGLTLAFAQPGAHHRCCFRTERCATLFSAFPETVHVGSGP
jgi:hypothetical protein